MPALREVCGPSPSPGGSAVPLLGRPAGATQAISQHPGEGPPVSGRVFLAAGKAWPRGRLGLCEWTRYECTCPRSHMLPLHRHGRKQPGGMCLIQTSRGGDGRSGCPGRDHPQALQAPLTSSPPGSLSLHSQPSSRGSLPLLFKDPLFLEETFDLAWVGSFVWVARAGRPSVASPCTHSGSHTIPSGPWSAPRGPPGPGMEMTFCFL